MSPESVLQDVGSEDILTVSALNRLARQTLESRFPLLWVSGEISNLRRPASGHVYFALKDEAAQVDCVMFRGRAQLLPFRLQEGMRVEARALVTLYEARGGFQLNVEALRHAGVGVLFEAFSRLRSRLESEGLFAPERKLPLPRFPSRVGLVTSLQAAALRDVVAALARRAPHLPIVIYPTLVQGDGAAAAIAEAVSTASRRRDCDVLIVARGGGSIEDLWSFNEEVVARAIDDSTIPVITGIGHETDTTIADLVADCRAATPTAAAELASDGYVKAQNDVTRLVAALDMRIRRFLQERMQRVDLLASRLIRPGERLRRLDAVTAHLATRLNAAMHQRLHADGRELQRLKACLTQCRPDLRHARRDLGELAARMRATSVNLMSRNSNRLEGLAASLAHLSPQAVLSRGYSLVRKAGGEIVHSSEQISLGETLHLTFGAGEAVAQVTQKKDS